MVLIKGRAQRRAAGQGGALKEQVGKAEGDLLHPDSDWVAGPVRVRM